MPLWILCNFSLVVICSTLDEAKLKEKGRSFHDLFLTKVCVQFTVLSFFSVSPSHGKAGIEDM